MEDDLYGDLDAGVASAEVARLRADLSRAEASAATADGELSRARAEAAQLRQANEILERNISVLFNTAPPSSRARTARSPGCRGQRVHDKDSQNLLT